MTFWYGSGPLTNGSDSFLQGRKKFFFFIFLLITCPQAHHLQSKKFNFLQKFCVKILFCRHYFSPLNTFMSKRKNPVPDPYLWLMYPDPGAQKHADPDPQHWFIHIVHERKEQFKPVTRPPWLILGWEEGAGQPGVLQDQRDVRGRVVTRLPALSATNRLIGAHQCCGSMTFWCGSGSADSMPLIYGSGFGSWYFRHWPSRCHNKKFIKKSQNSRSQGFSNYFCLMIEGSRRPKNIRIRILIIIKAEHW